MRFNIAKDRSFKVSELVPRLERDIEMCDLQAGRTWRNGDMDRAREWVGAGKALKSVQDQLRASVWPHVEEEEGLEKVKKETQVVKDEVSPPEEEGEVKMGPLVCEICGATYGTEKNARRYLVSKCVREGNGWGSRLTGGGKYPEDCKMHCPDCSKKACADEAAGAEEKEEMRDGEE